MKTNNLLFYDFLQLAVLFATLAAIHAQFITPSLTTQDQNIYRTLGNLGQVSTHSKTIDTPFSSVSKSDVRVSNPGIYGGLGLTHGVAPLGLAHAGIASPYALAHAGIASPYAHPLGLAHAGIATPIATSPLLAAQRLALARGHIASPYIAAPAIAKTVGVAPAGLLGVAYSAAPAVAHMSYSNGLGISYTW